MIYELDPVEAIAVAAMGEPGHRQFFLMASGQGRTLTLSCEKAQIQALIVRLHQMLDVLRGASNYTFLARLRPHEKDGLLAVYKPERGESPLWDFPSGTLFKREVAAYELSKVLGWPRIPPTVVRKTGPHGIGAMQLFVDGDDRHFLSEQAARRDDWMRVALFDVLANNADRKSGHCLFDAQDRVWV